MEERVLAATLATMAGKAAVVEGAEKELEEAPTVAVWVEQVELAELD